MMTLGHFFIGFETMNSVKCLKAQQLLCASSVIQAMKNEKCKIPTYQEVVRDDKVCHLIVEKTACCFALWRQLLFIVLFAIGATSSRTTLYKLLVIFLSNWASIFCILQVLKQNLVPFRCRTWGRLPKPEGPSAVRTPIIPYDTPISPPAFC